MYLVLDKGAPWRYTRGPFVFLDGLKSSLTQARRDGRDARDDGFAYSSGSQSLGLP